MNIIKKILLLITVFSGTLLFSGASSPAYAIFEGAKGEACKGANLQDTAAAANCNTDGAASDLGTTVKAAISILSIIVGIIAVILIIVNGLRFITANGDSNSINSARNGVIYAVIGLIIAAFAQIIVRFVLTRI